MRKPAPLAPFVSAAMACALSRNAAHVWISPNFVTVCARSGSLKIQDRSLREDVRGAEAGRMVGVAFDFSWAALRGFPPASRSRPRQTAIAVA